MSVMTFLRKLAPSFAPSRPQERIPVIGFGREAGVTVSHETAMTIAAYYRCVRVIADSLGYIDWRVKRRRVDGGSDIQPTHPVDKLLNRKANTVMTAFQFKELMISWALIWGNGLAWIERNERNEIIALWPIAPWQVTIEVRQGWRIVYVVKSDGKDPITIEAKDVFHLRNLGENGYEGYSVVTLARRSLGLAIATEDHGNSLFGNAARPAGVLEHPGKLSVEAKDSIRDDWERRFKGPGKAWGTAVLQEGMKFNSLSMPQEDAQFLQTRKFSVIDICRWVGVHPYKCYDLEGMKYSNTENVNRDFHSDTLAPWATRLEQEANDKLLGQDVLFTDFDFRMLLRGDVATRTGMYSGLFDRGVFSINDIRIREGDNPVPHGNERFVPMNIQTIERATQEPEPMAPTLPDEEPEEPDVDDGDESEVDEEALTVLRGLLSDSLLRILRREKRLAERAKEQNEKRADYEAAILQHLMNDRKKAYDDLRSSIEAVGQFACRVSWGWWAEFTVNAFLNSRGPKTLSLCLDAFDEGDVVPYMELHELGRANDAASDLLKTCLVAARAASSLEISNGKDRDAGGISSSIPTDRRGSGCLYNSRNGLGGKGAIQDSISG